MYGFVCEHRYDGRCLAVVVDDVMLVPLQREHPDTALEQHLVDGVGDEREVLHVTRRLGPQQVKFPVK